MWWFDKDKPKEIWDEATQWPIGDIEAAERIRNICRSASNSAEKVGSLAIRADSKRKSDHRKHELEAARYERAAKVAMEIAMKISDGLMRDSAVGEIIELCLKANDRRTARILFRAIQSASIREDTLRDHPALSE
jgi:hypothetical protein